MPEFCALCGEEKEHVDEAMVSGFSGYVCTTETCPKDR